MKLLAFEKSVGAVLFREEAGKRNYLLLKYRSGQWDFLKGHVEKDETERETLLREIKEESGIENVEIIDGFRTTNRFFYSAKGNEFRERVENKKGVHIFKRAVFYLVKTLENEVVLNHENSEYVWVGFEKALQMFSNEGSKRTMKRAHEFLGK